MPQKRGHNLTTTRFDLTDFGLWVGLAFVCQLVAKITLGTGKDVEARRRASPFTFIVDTGFTRFAAYIVAYDATITRFETALFGTLLARRTTDFGIVG